MRATGRLRLAVGFLMAAVPLSAQSTGSVTGRVVEAENGRGIAGAEVRVTGTAARGFTNADGRFQLVGVPAGTRQVSARALGHRETAASVTVSAGSAASVELRLSEEAIPLDPMLVVGEKLLRGVEQTVSSVAVLNGTVLEEAAIDDLEDAFRLAGNVRDADWVDAGIVIRGINSEGVAGPSGSPLATVYVDGVPRTQNGTRRGALNAWDVQQVEVWRGPQSTLSGRNALAGKIEVRTNEPTFFWEAAAQAEAGDRGRNAEAVMVSGPLVRDRLAFRVAAERRHESGVVDYPLYEGLPALEERQDDDSWLVRGKLLLAPASESGLRAQLTASRSYDSPMYLDVDGASGDPSQYGGAGPLAFGDRVWGLQVLREFVEARSTETGQVGLELSLPLGGAWAVSATSGLSDTETSRPSVDLASRGAIDERELSQELRLTRTGTALDAVVGVFALDGRVEATQEQQRSYEAFSRRSRSERGYTNLALFGEATWRIGGGWSVVAGARLDRESADFSSVSRRLGADGSLLAESTSSTDDSFDTFLPKAGLAWGWDEGSVGFTAQRAFRAGGSAINFVTGEPYEYDPESAWNYELAFRHAPAGAPLQYRINLFHLDWRDQQLNVPQVPGDFSSDIILNAGRSTVTGGELELTVQPLPRLEAFGSLGVSRTEFEDFTYLQFGNELDLSGEPFPQAPETSAAVGAQYRAPAGLFVAGDANYTGSVLSRSVLEGGPRDELPSYALLNLRAGWRNDRFSVTGYVDNVLDEDYFLYRYDDPGFQLATLGMPRSIGVVVKAEIGPSAR